MSNFAQDDFSGASEGADLSTHTDTLGNSWTEQPSTTGSIKITNTQTPSMAYAGAANTTSYYYDGGTPPSADYTVQADVRSGSGGVGASTSALAGRMDTAAKTEYLMRVESGNQTHQLRLAKNVAGTFTTLATQATTINDNTVYTSTQLVMTGTSLSGTFNGTTDAITATDSSISAAGKAGISLFTGAGGTSSGGVENFSAFGAAAAAAVPYDPWPLWAPLLAQ